MHENCDLKFEFLRECETEFNKSVARESGAQGGLYDEKIEGRNSRDTVPLHCQNALA
jgi:hypothetical protein